MADADVIERLEATEHKVRGVEELAFSFADTINTRTARYDPEFAEIRSRFGFLDRAVAMLQTDVRDMRSGVTIQLRLARNDVTALGQQVKGLDDKLEAFRAETTTMLEAFHAETTAKLEAFHAETTAKLESFRAETTAKLAETTAKLDAILAKLP